MTTIDLGFTDRTDEEQDDVEPGHRAMRRYGLVVVAGLCLLGVTGSDRPQPPRVRPLWSVPVADQDATMLTDDTAYVHRAGAGAGEARLTAYDLATGRMRWSRATGDTAGYLSPAPDAGLVLLPAGRYSVPLTLGATDTTATTVNRETIALNAATGAEVWRYPGDPQAIYHDTALMAAYRDDGELARLRLIRLADHAVLWDRATPGAGNLTLGFDGDRPDTIVTATDAGEIAIYRFADGSVLTRARIPWARPNPQEGFFTDMVPSQGYLAVNRTDPHTSVMTVYRMDTMAPVWRIDRTGGFAFDCAPALCLNAGNGMVAYDAGSGTVRWRLPDTVGAWTTGADRVVLSNGSEDGTSYLLDAATGARIGPPARGSTVRDARPDGALLLLRSTTTPADRTSITRWDLTTGRQDVLGTLDKMPGSRCEAVSRFLACRHDNLFQVAGVG